MSKPIYPIVRCDQHRNQPDAPGYMICAHVARRERSVAVYDPPSPEHIGVIVCEKCDAELAAQKSSDHVNLACMYCVTEQNLIPN